MTDKEFKEEYNKAIENETPIIKREEEFNLSDKIRLKEDGSDEEQYKNILIMDIKEFIKRLKATLCNEAIERELAIDDPSLDRVPLAELVRRIDKLAGGDLI